MPVKKHSLGEASDLHSLNVAFASREAELLAALEEARRANADLSARVTAADQRARSAESSHQNLRERAETAHARADALERALESAERRAEAAERSAHDAERRADRVELGAWLMAPFEGQGTASDTTARSPAAGPLLERFDDPTVAEAAVSLEANRSTSDIFLQRAHGLVEGIAAIADGARERVAGDIDAAIAALTIRQSDLQSWLEKRLTASMRLERRVETETIRLTHQVRRQAGMSENLDVLVGRLEVLREHMQGSAQQGLDALVSELSARVARIDQLTAENRGLQEELRDAIARSARSEEIIRSQERALESARDGERARKAEVESRRAESSRLADQLSGLADALSDSRQEASRLRLELDIANRASGRHAELVESQADELARMRVREDDQRRLVASLSSGSEKLSAELAMRVEQAERLEGVATRTAKELLESKARIHDYVLSMESRSTELAAALDRERQQQVVLELLRTMCREREEAVTKLQELLDRSESRAEHLDRTIDASNMELSLAAATIRALEYESTARRSANDIISSRFEKLKAELEIHRAARKLNAARALAYRKQLRGRVRSPSEQAQEARRFSVSVPLRAPLARAPMLPAGSSVGAKSVDATPSCPPVRTAGAIHGIDYAEHLAAASKDEGTIR